MMMLYLRKTLSFSGLRCVAVVLLVLPCLQVHAVAPSDWTGDAFYLRADGGVHFLDLPESSPFVRTNGREEVVGFLEHYDAEFRSGSRAQLTVGRNYHALGKDLFTEFSGFLSSYSSTHTNHYSEDAAPWTEVRTQFENQYCPQGTELGACITAETEQHLVSLIKNDPHVRSVGWIGRIDGGEIPFGTPNFAWGDPIRIRTERKVDYHGLGLVTGTLFSQTGQARFRLYAGPGFRRLEQESETFAYESNRDPEVNSLTLEEDLKASYYGADLGGRIEVPFRQHWQLMVDGKLGLFYLDSEYEGSQRTLLTSADPALDELTQWDDDDSNVAVTLGVETSLSVNLFENLVLRLAVGGEYLSRAPVMRYARHGESLASGQPHSAARIAYSDAFGYFGTISLGIDLRQGAQRR